MNPLFDLYDLADDEDITVDSFVLGSREALSIQEDDGSCYIAINPLKITSEKDETVKLAHEMGHCITGSFYNEYATCDIRQKHENRADKWAIETIIPKEKLQKAIRDGCTKIWELADYFGVTEELMKKAVCWYRYGNLAVDAYM